MYAKPSWNLGTALQRRRAAGAPEETACRCLTQWRASLHGGLWFANRAWLSRRLTVEFWDPGRRPASHADGRYHLVIDGELWNADELARRHHHELSVVQPTSQAEIALRLIVAHGPEIVREFNGLFAIVLCDARQQSITLINDRYGFRPIFYCPGKRGMAFATELKGIRAADEATLRLDEVGLFELFLHGHHLYGRNMD